MMKKIHKYQLLHGITQLPVGAKILHIGIQDEIVCAWAMVDKNAAMVDTFRVILTGEEFDPKSIKSFAGTFLTHSGECIVHVFKLTR